jgi:hypothetical protein
MSQGYDHRIELKSRAMSEAYIKEPQLPLETATPEVQEIVERVLQLEKEKLYLKNPRNINDDVLQIIKEIVQ